MKYRYIDLRRQELQNILRFRSNLEFSFCEFLVKMNDFVNVSTPSLFLGTPGGAREFVVPTKQPGMCYSLIQSPQQHKQLLMVGGLDRYMQLARCYRNEMSRPDRQPEFTQLDIEMSFVSRKQLQQLIEDMLSFSLMNVIPNFITPFPVMSYNDAIRLYGTDKPDTRFYMKIERFTRSGINLIGLRLFPDLYESIDINSMQKHLNQVFNVHKLPVRICY